MTAPSDGTADRAMLYANELDTVPSPLGEKVGMRGLLIAMRSRRNRGPPGAAQLSAVSASPKPFSEIGMPMPASSVWKMMKMAVLPVFSFSTSVSSATTWA